MKLNKEQRNVIIKRSSKAYNDDYDAKVKNYLETKEGRKEFNTWKDKYYPSFEKIVKFIKDNKIKGNFITNGYAIHEESSVEHLKDKYFSIERYHIADKLKITRFNNNAAEEFLILKSIENKDFNLEELVKELVAL